MQQASPKTIIVFSGPSGGHLFPAQAFAEAAHAEASCSIVLVTSIRAKGLCSKFPQGIFSEIVYLPEFGSPIGLSLAGVKAVLNIPVAIWQSWSLLSRLKPALCVGFGSFVSYFGVLFSAWRGIPTLIHEQNQVPGKATRMLQGTVKTIAVSYPETAFRKPPREVIVTGLPIRRDIRESGIAPDQKPAQPFTVLICGGSQGSNFLNSAVLSAFSGISAEERSKFAVIHITGGGQENQVREGYAKLGIPAEVYPFFEKMEQLYRRAHMAVSRAGANSSFEQALYGIPTVFIPYPFAEGHQNDNACYFVTKGAAKTVPQDNEAGAKVAEYFKAWKSYPIEFEEMMKKMRLLSCADGHERLWNIAKNMLKLNTCNS